MSPVDIETEEDQKLNDESAIDIDSDEDKKQFLHEATKLAIESVEKGWGGPFGAVIVRNGKIIGRGQNRVLFDRYPDLSRRSNCDHRRLLSHQSQGPAWFRLLRRKS
jgi:hypothetical protein